MPNFSVVTLFPSMFTSLQYGIIGRAIDQGKIQLAYFNPRFYTHNKHGYVDDTPYGGGPGMILKAEPMINAISAAKAQQTAGHVIALSPCGQPFNQQLANRLSKKKHLILVCGRYEGIDQRAIDHSCDELISAGDYIVSGGELPAMMMIDAITRLIPNVLNNQNSLVDESFNQSGLSYPQYTKPAQVAGLKVPSVLQNGNHQAITQWRKKASKQLTLDNRPDLIASSKSSDANE
jgi:tRNA (guanine37-N1)-methyltransferase